MWQPSLLITGEGNSGLSGWQSSPQDWFFKSFLSILHAFRTLVQWCTLPKSYCIVTMQKHVFMWIILCNVLWIYDIMTVYNWLWIRNKSEIYYIDLSFIADPIFCSVYYISTLSKLMLNSKNNNINKLVTTIICPGNEWVRTFAVMPRYPKAVKVSGKKRSGNYKRTCSA